MKKYLLFSFLLIAFLFNGCDQKDNSLPLYERHIVSLDVLNVDAQDIIVDAFIRKITIGFPQGADLTSVELSLQLEEGVTMLAPAAATAFYDLSDSETTIQFQKNGKTATYSFEVGFYVPEFDPSDKGWVRQSDDALPDHIAVYEYTKTVEERNVKAYIAVSDMNDPDARFSVLGEAQGYHTPSAFYSNTSNPAIVINAGYFWDGYALGMVVRDGQVIVPAQPVVWRPYNGESTAYYPTWAVFGVDATRQFNVHWAYTADNGIAYSYPNPAPNKLGTAPLAMPSASFPEGAEEWRPVTAISGGPVLIKDGEYRNTWEAEMFDSGSGINPTGLAPRSAVGVTPSGHLVFFVAEGRNVTPNVPGLTLKNVADLMMELGCSEAMNLDGGGSSCMLVNGSETIKPSEGTQRAIVTALALY